MLRTFTPLALLLASVSAGADEIAFDPAGVSEIDAINCRLDAPSYNGFAAAVGSEDDIAGKRHWKKVETDNPFMNKYELPVPIVVAGTYTTRRIAFSASGIVAILDLADPGVLAKQEGIGNAMDPEPLIAEIVASGKATREQIEAEMPFRKVLGERVISETTELPAKGESFGFHTRITRNISNVSSHPGKTLYGCNYAMELIGKDGKPI